MINHKKTMNSHQLTTHKNSHQVHFHYQIIPYLTGPVAFYLLLCVAVLFQVL